MIHKIALGILLVCAAPSQARVVGEYRMAVALGAAGREPAFLHSPEDGWSCRVVGAMSFQELDRDGEIERLVSERGVTEGDFLRSPRVAMVFHRNLGARAAGAKLLLRANCRRAGQRAWIGWRCAIGERLPEKLWHSQVVSCRAARYSVPAGDPQSQLLRALRNRTMTVTITLANRTFVEKKFSELLSSLP